jgi:hypothetical protein
MAGQAMAQVTSQLEKTNTWAQQMLDAANAALSALGTTEMPTPGQYYIGSIDMLDISSYLDSASQAAAMAIGAAPDVVSLTLPITRPVKPTYTTPVLGAMHDIILPDIPPINFPSMDLTPPVYTLPTPKQWNFDVNNILISDDPLVMECINRLTNNIRYGGTGLTPAVEAAIWDRDLERNEQTLQDSTDKAVTAWAKMGFSLPDGMLAHSVAELQKEYENRRIDRSREIAIKQAELEQVNLFKSLELASGLMSSIIGLEIQYEKLVLEAQELTAKYANEYISMQIEVYKAQVEAYKVRAQVYENLIRAELAKVDVYKAQIEGQKLIGEINQQTVQVYSEKMKAIAIMMDAYKSEIQAMTAELEMEKTKIEANKLQFDAWAKKADVAISKYNGEVEMYKAASQINVSKAELVSKQWEATARINLAYREMAIKSLEASNTSADRRAQITMGALKGVADAYASMASGLMAALSARASMSYEEKATVMP